VANPDPECPVLEAAYGAPSQAGHGSAVFYEPMKAGDDPDQAALAKYRYFIGEPRDRWGGEDWMRPWKKACSRAAVAKPDIAVELSGIYNWMLPGGVLRGRRRVETLCSMSSNTIPKLRPGFSTGSPATLTCAVPSSRRR
jgi:hypothetical protein